jgi:hypothetical protein
LFTNLQLGLETESTTGAGATLSKDRAGLEAAIREGSSQEATIQIVDAAQLAALVNKHTTIRLTYFTPSVARSWDEKWNEEKAAKDYKVSVPFVGREEEVAQVSAWIADPTVKVIAICGPSGMGKTRLALETTRRELLRTTIVDVVAQLEQMGIRCLGTSAQPRIIVVEDPAEEQAIRLAKQAVSATGVKLIFTFPSEARTPQLKLNEHESVKQMTLQPLDRERSQKLLESTGVEFDYAARDWIIQQAGGVAEILLSAAELGPSLREKSGDLRKRLTDAYRRRIESGLGRDAIGILRLLSAVHWVSISGDKPDLPLLVSAVGQGISINTVLNHLVPLEQMGYLRRRGDHASVTPPLFAAALSEELFTSNAPALCELFDKLPDHSRKRLLERAVTTDLPEQALFWDHVFDAELGTTERLVANLDLLDSLARAIPARAARFLESRIEALANLLGSNEHDRKRSSLLVTLKELAYTGESSATGMRLLQVMAVREEWQKKPSSATELFCECFVHWYFVFPLSFQNREQWIRQMLASADDRERWLGAQAVVMATTPPHALSGYSVHARRLRERPASRRWKDVHDYLENLIELRFELTQNCDPNIAELAQDGFIRAFQERFIPPDRNVSGLEKFMQWQRARKLEEDEREIRQVIHCVESEYVERSQQPDQMEHADKWVSVLARLAALRRQLDDGSFDLRLKIAVGRAFAHDWEELDGKRVYGYETRCRVLAEEAVAKRELMTDAAWRLLRDDGSYNAQTFIIALGAADRSASFLPRFEMDLADERGSHNYGLYLVGVQRHSPDLVDRRLDELAVRQDVPKQNLLTLIKLAGPTAGNRRRLLQLLAEKSVEPSAVARMFAVGRWLGSIPDSEVRTILEFIATGPPDWPKWTVDILSLYLHHNKPLPAELIPIAERALREVDTADGHVDWSSGQVAVGIARTNLESAFQLLRSQIAASKQADWRTRQLHQMWRPFHRHGPNDFWDFMRGLAPERAYRELLALQGAQSESEVGLVLDLEKHRDVLLKIAREDEANAVFFSRLVSGAQPGFFPFSYSLMGLFPGNGTVPSHLASAAVYQLSFGFGDGHYSQALERVEAEIKSESTPKQFLAWLENLKSQVNGAMRRDRPRPEADSYLGWD